MRIAELVAPREFRIVEAPAPEPGPGEVLVGVQACGVCSSELGQWTGAAEFDYPRRIGHEVCGTVVALGADTTTYTVGDPVGVWTGGGGFAELVAVAEDACRPLPEDLPVPLGLVEPIACAANAVELAEVRLTDSVLIIGAGFMGLLVLQLVRLRGPRQVVVADSRSDVLSLAATLGADRTINVTEESLVAVVHQLTGGQGADLTFEVTGAQAAVDVIGDVTRMSGKLVLVGFHTGEPRRVPLGQWNWMAFDLRNAHFRDPAVIRRGMTVGTVLLATGRLQMAPLVTHRFSLPEINEAFQTAIDKPEGFVKAVVEVAGGEGASI